MEAILAKLAAMEASFAGALRDQEAKTAKLQLELAAANSKIQELEDQSGSEVESEKERDEEYFKALVYPELLEGNPHKCQSQIVSYR